MLHWRWTGVICAAVFIGALATAPSSFAAAGSLDSSFDVDGRVTTDLGSPSEEAHALAIQPDGRLVVAGMSEDIDEFVRFPVLLRYGTDGALDPSFDDDGVCFITAPEPTDVAVQSDGKIVVVGEYEGDFALARFDTDCTPDATFSGDGFQRVDFLGGSDGASAMALLPDGRIVVVGTGQPEFSSGLDFVVARFGTDGALDESFSSDGWLRTHFAVNDHAYAVALQEDGKIVVAGTTDGRRFESMDFALARYTSEGALDIAFSGNGKLRTSFSAVDKAFAVALQADGKIVAGGIAAGGWGTDFALARYTTAGVLDTTFSDDGKRRTDFSDGNDEAHGLAIQANGRIILAGSANPPGGTGDDVVALARYRPGGRLDRTFSEDGKVRTRFGKNPLDYGKDVALQADGRIVVTGDVTRSNVSGYDFGLARYLAE
jgi:uncharacterized delta-60 repeat protein